METDRWTKDATQHTKVLNEFRVEMKSSNDGISKSFHSTADDWMNGLKNRINKGGEAFSGACALISNSTLFLSFL